MFIRVLTTHSMILLISILTVLAVLVFREIFVLKANRIYVVLVSFCILYPAYLLRDLFVGALSALSTDARLPAVLIASASTSGPVSVVIFSLSLFRRISYYNLVLHPILIVAWVCTYTRHAKRMCEWDDYYVFGVIIGASFCAELCVLRAINYFRI